MTLQESRNLKDATEVEKLQCEGREAASFLKTSIVQAAPNEKGNLDIELSKEHAGTVVEPIAPGMDLPKEKGKKKA